MITIQSAESALKEIYLDSVIHDINTKTNPFLTMVQKNTKTVGGREARATVRYGNEGSVAVGAEGGVLPTGAVNRIAEIVTPLKNLYGTFQISDKAIRAAQNNPGAFASMLAGEMKNLIGAAQSGVNAMLYGNGLKCVAYVDEASKTGPRKFTPIARFANEFTVGRTFRVAGSNNVFGADLTVASVVNGDVSMNANVDFSNGTRLYFYETTDAGTELNGVDSIFRQDKIYNLVKSEHPEIAPCAVVDYNVHTLTEVEAMKFFDKLEEHCQGNPADIVLIDPVVRRSLYESMRTQATNIDTAELAGGFRGFTLNGCPTYSDIKCKANTMYALNSGSWAMHQLCDWTWLSGDEGGILKQIDGRAGYSATLVKYADLMCDKPFLQGKAAY